MKIGLSKSTKRVRLWVLTSILALVAAFSFAAAPPGTKGFYLYWDKPAALPDAWFVYYTTNATLPVTNWTLLAALTNPPSINGGAQLVHTNYLPPAAYFFTLSASNFWGNPFFSNAVSLPQPLPQPLLLNLGIGSAQ